MPVVETPARRLRDATPFVAAAFWLAALLGVPLAALAWEAVSGGMAQHLRDPTVHSAIGLSLVTSAVSTGIVVVTGTPLAYLLARWRFPGHSVIQTLVDLPIVLPPMVAGIALLQVFGRQGWVGQVLAQVGITVPFTTVAVVLAQVFVAGPFFVRAARTAFAGVDVSVREAAYVDGADELQAFRRVALPLARRGLFSGVVLCWARAVGEFGATIFFAGNLVGVTQTIPLAIFTGFEADTGIAVGLSFVLMLTSLSVLLLMRWAARKE